MRERIWNELFQVKHNHFYCLFLLARQKRVLNIFNMTILVFSSAGIMGWPLWKNAPLISCLIVSSISLIKLISPYIIPSDKQIEKLDDITDFYCNYFNKLEQLWYDFYNERVTENEAQNNFYELKNLERDINKTVNEIVKSTNKKIYKRADTETRNYLQINFN